MGKGVWVIQSFINVGVGMGVYSAMVVLCCFYVLLHRRCLLNYYKELLLGMMSLWLFQFFFSLMVDDVHLYCKKFICLFT